MSRRAMQKRSLVLSGHGTSVALEPEFWNALEAIAAGRGDSLALLVEAVDSRRNPARSLASALRVLALEEFREKMRSEPSALTSC